MPFFSKNITALTTSDLAELLADSAVENVRLEFKRDVPGPDERLKKLSGFANTFGGYLIVGAEANSSDGRLVKYPGVARQPNYRQSIVQRCYEGMWPPIEVLVSDGIPAPAAEDQVCYVIYVPESMEAPHFLTKRRGAWIRTDEFSHRFETRLAEFDEIKHLMNRRALAIERRELLHRRAVGRFDALVASEYANAPGTSSTIGATLSLSVGPQFPTRRLVSDHDLLVLIESQRVPWRSVGFPDGREMITQQDSVLVLQPVLGFSMCEANGWGYLVYSCEIEHLARSEESQVSGIHLYAFLGHILVFLEHARMVYRTLGYDGSLIVRALLKRVRGKPFMQLPYGNVPAIGPASRIDDEISLDISTSATRLREERDKVAGDLLKTLFFALNWPQQGADVETVKDLLDKGAHYNSWNRP